LMGRWNWWAPAPLVRLHARIGLRDELDDTGYVPGNEPVKELTATR